MYKIIFNNKTKKNMVNLKRSKYYNYANELIKEIEINPFNTISSLEKITNDEEIFYSRRINSKHRIVYQVDKDKREVVIYELWGHYDSMGKKKRKK
jgi:Txe/YoeB family toxin of toxin-antitoxin system